MFTTNISIFLFLKSRIWTAAEIKNSINTDYNEQKNILLSTIQVSSSFFNFNTFCGDASLKRERDKNRSDHKNRIFT